MTCLFETEVWMPIKGYEELYHVSSEGRIKKPRRLTCKNSQIRKDRKKVHEEIIIKPLINKDGYVYVCLNKLGKMMRVKTSRIVAQHFIPNPKNKAQVNHIDGDKQNNRVINLEWTTPKENTNHAIDTGIRQRRIHRKLTIAQIKEIKSGRFNGMVHKEIAKLFGVSRPMISYIIKGKSWPDITRMKNPTEELKDQNNLGQSDENPF